MKTNTEQPMTRRITNWGLPKPYGTISGRGTSVFALACLLLALAVVPASAQNDDADSTWDDYGLNPDGFKLDEDVFGHVSTGWFPQPYSAYTLSYSGSAFFADVYDRAPGIRSRSFAATSQPFTGTDPYDGSSERKIMQPNSDEEEDDGYPTTNYDEYSLTFLYNLPFPCVLRASAGLQVTEGLLFSNDESRSYLTIGGAKQRFKEVGVVYMKQYSLMGSAGLVIPFYGGFIKNEALQMSSYYYIFGGVSGSYAVSSKATQYEQIASAKDQIRYGNGADTVTLINKRTLAGLNRGRTAIEGGIGWNLAFESIALGVEAFVSLPQTSVLDDAEWKQYFVGLRLSLGVHWVDD